MGPRLPIPAPPADDRSHTASILSTLGSRIRRLREAKSWTRADLASRSGLSVRFLARVESGDGNISLLRLEHLAGALNTTPGELLRAEPLRSGGVALVGMRGAGKSTVGPILARKLSLPFVEMDARIQEASGLPLDQIFELHGERYYRRIELDALLGILEEARPAVLAAAGGVVNEPVTWDLLLERCFVVWLQARPEDHWGRVIAQGDRRPMGDNPHAMEELRSMLAARERLYRRAHFIVDTSIRTPAEAAEVIASALASLEREGK